MACSDIRNFEGQSWSSFSKIIEKESGSKKVSFVSDDSQTHSNSISLSKEDFNHYVKYHGAEPFILALCGYCGDRFKKSALAHHLARRHPDDKAVDTPEENSSKADAKSPNSILKKNKLKPSKPNIAVKNKESLTNEETSTIKEISSNKEAFNNKEPFDKKEDLISLSSPVKTNKLSRVIIQVDRRRVNGTSTNKDIFSNRNNSDIQVDPKPPTDSVKNSLTRTKSDSTKVKRFKDEKAFPMPRPSSTRMANGNNEHVESISSRNKEKSTDNNKKIIKNHLLPEQDKTDISKFKVQEENFSGGIVLPAENGISDDQSDDSNIDFKRRRNTGKVRTYNPDRHCGVIRKDNSKPCTRSLSCKSHTMSLRRAVRGRSKNFDQLLADYRAEKETSKHKISDTTMEINISPDGIKKLQLTPIKTPLVSNPHLTQVDSVKESINCNLHPNKNMNGVRVNCNKASEIIHTINKHKHFQPNNIPRKKLKKRKKKRKSGNVKKSQVKCFSAWYPWYRRIGGLLYTQNNLPSFANLKNSKKKAKILYNVKKENSRYSMHTAIPEGSYENGKSLIEE